MSWRYAYDLLSAVTGLYLMYTHLWSQQSSLEKIEDGRGQWRENSKSDRMCDETASLILNLCISGTPESRTSANTTERPKTSRKTRLRPLGTCQAIMAQVPTTLVET